MRALALVFAIALCTSCDLLESERPACISPDGGASCDEAWCNLVRGACAKRARLCDAGQDVCDVEVCTETITADLLAGDNPAAAASALHRCAARSTTCEGDGNKDKIKDCFQAAAAPRECRNLRAATRSSMEEVLPTRLPALANGTPGVVVLPGDDLDCLRCALAEGGCGQQHPDCFSAAPLAAGATDSCLDYRVCLRTCEQTSGEDVLRYQQCAAHACDVSEHDQGRLVFAQYRACMFEHCSACFMQ